MKKFLKDRNDGVTEKKLYEKITAEETTDSMDLDMEVIDIDKKRKGRDRRRKTESAAGRNALIALGGLLAALILFYVGLGFFFQSHFFPRTRMEEINCSLKTAAQAQDIISREAAGYELVIEGREGMSETVTMADIDLAPVFDSSLAEAVEGQNGFLWPIYLFKENKIQIPVDMQYSQEKLSGKVESFSFFDGASVREPRSAYIGEFDGSGYPIVEEDAGTLLDKELTYRKITEAIDNLDENLSLDESGCYAAPAVTKNSPELVKKQELMNRYVGAVITYRFGGDTETVDAALISQWLSADGDQVVIDPEKVRDYVNELSRKYDTFGRERQFRTSAGETITVNHGNYGWWMDRAAETEGLIEAVKAGQQADREPVYRAKAAQYGEDDIGGTYVEIDLTNQHLYLYVSGQRTLETDFVSGNIFKGNATPTGVFAITYKERDATLNGENYSSPVDYWMPFNGNVGMHDATWRRQFGGDIYLTNGSHGCVNLPHDKAEKIYEYVEKGTPVIVYGGYQGPTPEEQEQMLLQQQIDALMQQGLLNGQIPPGILPGDGTVPPGGAGMPGDGTTPPAGAGTAGDGTAPPAGTGTPGDGITPPAGAGTAGEGAAPFAGTGTPGEGAAPSGGTGAAGDAQGTEVPSP